jgi:ABC-2 type transport system permease protein
VTATTAAGPRAGLRRAGFGTALRAELLKTTSTRMWWVLLAVGAAYVAMISAFLAVSFATTPPDAMGPAAPSLDDPTARLMLYTLSMPVAYVFPALAGALAVTAEYRYQTLTPTFLGEPRRALVLAAKLVCATALGLLFGAATVAANVAGVMPVLAGTGHEVGLDGHVLAALAKVVLGMGLWAALGLGVGALVRHQVAAIVIVVAVSQIVEPLLRFGLAAWDATRSASQFLPGAAGDAMAGASIFTVSGQVELLEWWQGALVLAAYAAAAFAAGAATTLRRDVA